MLGEGLENPAVERADQNLSEHKTSEDVKLQLEQKRGSDGGMSRSASRMGGNTTYESNSTLDNTFDMTSVDENG